MLTAELSLLSKGDIERGKSSKRRERERESLKDGRTSKSISYDSSPSTHIEKLMHSWEFSVGLCSFLEDLA